MTDSVGVKHFPHLIGRVNMLCLALDNEQTHVLKLICMLAATQNLSH